MFHFYKCVFRFLFLCLVNYRYVRLLLSLFNYISLPFQLIVYVCIYLERFILFDTNINFVLLTLAIIHIFLELQLFYWLEFTSLPYFLSNELHQYHTYLIACYLFLYPYYDLLFLYYLFPNKDWRELVTEHHIALIVFYPTRFNYVKG